MKLIVCLVSMYFEYILKTDVKIFPLVISVLYFMQTAVVLLAVGILQGAGKANHSLA